MDKPAQVLVVQYKCFHWDDTAHKGDKMDHDIDAPDELMLNNVMYQLTGIVVQ